MSSLVEFVAEENKTGLSDYYSYVRSLVSELSKGGFVDVVIDSCGNETLPIVVNPTESSSVFSCVFEKTNETKNVWELLFQFGSYNSILQLMISISSETYEISVGNEELEKLKLFIKNKIVHDWKNIIWLMDNDSKRLSDDLFPRFYNVESQLRRFINSVMIKAYGSSWWDRFVPKTMKDKHHARLKAYKSSVPGFNNVDDRLLSIDWGDLLKIISLEEKKWIPTFDDEINGQIGGLLEERPQRIVELLRKQMSVNESLWDKWFSKYLPETFKSDLELLEGYRNHLFHSKLLDRSAYRTTIKALERTENTIDEAIKKQETDILSKEELASANDEKVFYYALRVAMEKENKELDTSVCIRNEDEIKELLVDAVDNVFESIIDNLRFREDIDIEVSGSFGCGDIVLSITSRVTDKTIDLAAEYHICDEEGSESTVDILCGEQYRETITYTNGEAEYDIEQGGYVPVTKDELSDSEIEDVIERVLDYIDSETNIKKIAHDAEYRYVKDGERSPVDSDLLCSECGESEICVCEDFAPIGTCLNCGYKNTLLTCDICGMLFNGDVDGKVEEDGFTVCSNCQDRMNDNNGE